MRRIDPCRISSNGPDFPSTIWPTTIASPTVWWVVGGGKHRAVQITKDSGRHWTTVATHGLPNGCSIERLSAASARAAFAIARVPYRINGTDLLYLTHDGGHSWRQVKPSLH